MEYLESVVDPKDPHVSDIDIVFVHGLNPKGSETHARQTWTHSNGFFWPENLLRDELRTARILLFSYNSSILSSAADAHLSGHANNLCNRLKHVRLKEEELHRPLVFITHSLGGLIVKQALVIARNNPTYQCLKASTQGLVFFATPHRGSKNTGIAKFAANIYSAFTGQPRNSLLESLQKDSPITDFSNDLFRQQLDDYKILSFIETQKMSVRISRIFPAKKILIVDKTSATLGCQQEIHLNLDRNHSDICKFSGPDDKAYQTVGLNLKCMTDQARERQVQCENKGMYMSSLEHKSSSPVPYTSTTPGSLPSHIAVCGGRSHQVNLPRRCNTFLGREVLTREIKREMQKPPPRRVSLSGLGGVGKTELSISIVKELGPLQYVIYLHVTEGRLEGLEMAARDLRNEILHFSGRDLYFSPIGKKELVTMLMRWLKSTPNDGSRILVILDDLDGLTNFDDGPDPPSMAEYSNAFSGNGVDLIYTTRNPSMADSGSLWEATLFDVPSLHEDEAVNLLGHTLRGNYTTRDGFNTSSVQQVSSLKHDTGSRTQMVKIATHLGMLPAAIVLGSHYIKNMLGLTWNPDSCCKLFLEMWDQDSSKSEILSSHLPTLIYRHSMLASFNLSLQRLRQNVNYVPWYARNSYALLQLLSAMHLQEISPDDIPRFKNALRRAWHDLKGEIKKVPFREVVAERQAEGSPGTSVDKCIRDLVNVSLLTIRPTDGTLLLNNLTQACALSVSASNNISPKDKLVHEGNAKEMWRHWDPPRDGQA